MYASLCHISCFLYFLCQQSFHYFGNSHKRPFTLNTYIFGMLSWCGPAQKHQQGPITCSKWTDDLVQDEDIERRIECIGFEGFHQVKIERSIGLSRGDPSTKVSMCNKGPIQPYLAHEMRTAKGNKRILLQLGNNMVATFSFYF